MRTEDSAEGLRGDEEVEVDTVCHVALMLLGGRPSHLVGVGKRLISTG